MARKNVVKIFKDIVREENKFFKKLADEQKYLKK